MLERLTRYFQSLSPAAQAAILGFCSLLLIFQAAKRYEDQTATAFLLAVAAIVLVWLAFARIQ
jgi:hypothetical protein